MKTVGIIAEYNPLHNGHLFQLETARKLYGADCVVVAMSGNFTQRGDLAVFEKKIRAQMAVECGADVVIEIPSCFATAGLDVFAEGSVSLLNSIGIVDILLFGSECGDVDKLEKIALAMMDKDTYSVVRRGMSEEFSVSKYMNTKLVDFFDTNEIEEVMRITKSPNNILGILYIYYLKKSRSTIVPQTHKREGQNYLDEKMQESGYASASSIRKQLKEKKNYSYVLNNVPQILHRFYTEGISEAWMEEYISCRCEKYTKNINGQEYFEIDEGLFEKLPTYIDDNMIPAKMKRAVIHVEAKINKKEMEEIVDNITKIYIQVLAFNHESFQLEILNNQKNTKSQCEQLQYEIGCRTDELYEKIISGKGGYNEKTEPNS